MTTNKLEPARIRRRIGQSPFFKKRRCPEAFDLQASILAVLSALQDFESKNRDHLTPDLLQAVVRLTAATQELLPSVKQRAEPRQPAVQRLSLESPSESRSRPWTP